MACPGEGILTELAKTLGDNTVREYRYFRDFANHHRSFGIEHNSLVAKRNRLQKDIEDAEKRNENQIEDEVQNWIKEADNLIRKNTQIQQTSSYGRCPYWRYRQGKVLAQRVPDIKDHIQRCNFDRVARPAELPGIKYHASRDFIDFKSRKRQLNELVKALEDGNSYMIGLQGMGGTGKTTLATQVGKQLEESKAFEKVIIVVVSNPPDINKIQGEIARQLGSDLKQREGAERSEFLWSTISNKKQKLLIILDDVWGKLDLKEIGIPSGADHKNCYVMITTRSLKVCRSMRCEPIVHLDALGEEDGLHLFMFHATSGYDDSSSNDSKGLARDFVKECGRLPVAIVALASTLRSWPRGEWNAALTTLQNSKPFVDVDPDLVEVYNCLRLSYDHLNDEKAQKLFLLCSIFPEDYEFPVNLIIRLGIGSGIFGEVDEYYATRSQALGVKNKLRASSLLFKVEKKECVKMHDLVREVAQWIAKEDIQVIVPPKTTFEANKRFVFWRTDDFPDQIDGAKLEILLLWISGDALAKDANAFFARMSRLKILFLLGEYGRKVPSPLLSQSLLSLKSIQTLILDGWQIGDISVLKNLSSLVTLELENCLIIELPKDIEEIKKLRLLGLRRCVIQKNNPFEVIERCSQLEELYFVGNYDVKVWKPEDDKEIEDENAHDISSSALQMFSIACHRFQRFHNDDNGLLKCFNSEDVKHLLSEGMFKYLVKSAEVLELGRLEQTGWKSLVPDAIPVENGGNNLTKLYLYEWDEIKCLVDSSKYRYSDMTVFSKLVELRLYRVDVEELYRGAMPSGFLRQLKILKLSKCMKLQNIFLDKNLKLPNLKIMEVSDCPMWQPSVFQRSVAQSLVQLEELEVRKCEKLESLIAYESLEEEMRVVDSQKIYGILFPKLKSLYIKGCHKLEMVSSLLLAQDLPGLEDLLIMDCQGLKYIFGDYRDVGQVSQQEIVLPASLTTEVHLRDLPSLISIFEKCKKCMRRQPQVWKEDSKEKHESSKTSVSSWAQVCCFMAPTEDANAGVSSETPERGIMKQESCASNERIETFHTTKCRMRQLLCLQNIRQMTLGGCPKLKSIFRVSMVTTIMLEKLEIWDCEELKHIIIKEEEDNDRHDYTSIFPKLQQLKIFVCNELEFIFPATLSGALPKLKSLAIRIAHKLKYVFGKYDDEEWVSNENENNERRVDLPALERLSLIDVPNMMSICINKYQLERPSLKAVEAPEEIKEHMQYMTSGGSQETVNVETPLTPTVGFQNVLNLHSLQEIRISGNNKLTTLFSISACRNLPQLSKLYIVRCGELVNVVEDDSNDRHHMDYSSFFPKLEDLCIWECNKLEFIFPHSLFGSLQELKYLGIGGAFELKHIFRRYDDRDDLSNENGSDEPHIHLPALEVLTFGNVPKMINGRSFLDFIGKATKKLTKLAVRFSKIEEVLNLEGMEIEGPVMTLSLLEEMRLEYLSELRHICKGPKHILSLHNLCQLEITACKELRSIFSVSIVKSLPQLSHLNIKDSYKLIYIIEESADEDHSYQLCFPELETIKIRCCNSLKHIFSISTPGVFPKLTTLEIDEALELEQVFIWKQDAIENMAVEDAFPRLLKLKLTRLPMLVAICEGIDFQTVQNLTMHDCPKYEGITSQLIVHTEETSGSSNSIKVASMKETHEQGSQENDATEEATRAIQSTISESRKQTGVSSIIAQSSEEIEKEAVRIHASQLSMPPTWTSSKITRSIKETIGPGLEENYAEDDVVTAIQSTNSDSRKKYTGPIRLESEDEQSTCEATQLGQPQDLGEAKISIKFPHKTKIQVDDHSIEVIAKERVQESPISKDVVLETLLADLAPSNLSAESIATPQEEFSLNSAKTESRSSTIMINQQTLTAKASFSTGNIQEDTSTLKAKTDTPIICSQAGGSQSSPSTMSGESIQEKTTTVRAKADNSLFSHVEVSQISPSTMVASTKATVKKYFQKHDSSNEDEVAIQSTNLELMKQPRGSLDMPLAKGFAQTTKETRDTNVEDGLPSDFITSSHHQSQTGADGSSSPVLEIGEILELMELKDGEPALLAKALELHPQLRLSRGQLTRSVIAFGYRVLTDILVVLATKTPRTITTSDKLNLKENLDTATCLGFDKEWIESVRGKVFGIDMFDVMEEEIEAIKAKLETCDVMLEGVQKQRAEIQQHIAGVISQLEMVKMMEFRGIISGQDKSFGI